MSGFDNEVVVSIGERLQTSTAQAIGIMQSTATDVSRVNYSGNPNGNVAANPASLSHDPTTGNVWIKASGTGNTGWVLVAAPTTPFAVSTIVDDFYQSLITADPVTNVNPVGQLAWNTNGFVYTNGTATHPGLIVNSLTGSSFVWLTDFNTTHGVQVGGGVIQLNFVISLVTLSVLANRYTAWVGLLDDPVSPSNGIYFSYVDNVNSGQWVLTCRSGGVNTTVNTTTAAVTGFVNLGITINAAGTSVSFQVNGVSVGSAITTHIPTNALSPTFSLNRSSGSAPASLMDLFVMTNTLTTSR